MNTPRQNSALVVDRPLAGSFRYRYRSSSYRSPGFFFLFLSNSHILAHCNTSSARTQAVAVSHAASTATSPSRHSFRTPSLHLSILRSAFTRRAVTMSSDRQPKYRQEIQQVSGNPPRSLISHGTLQLSGRAAMLSSSGKLCLKLVRVVFCLW